MPSTYSTNLAIELIGTGDQAGVWGNTTNTNLGTLIEQAISGYVTQAVSTGTDTTITIPNGATGVARNMYIELTGTGGASTNLIVPSNKKLYFIFNNTSSGQVTVKVSGQTGVSVPNKAKMVLVSNGTDIVDATNYLANLSAASANITVLTSASATITNLLATSLTVSGNTFLATSSGNVGIANTSPSSYDSDMRNLVVGTSGATGISIISGTSSNGTLAFGDGTGAATYRGYVQYNHTNDYLVFGTAAAERMRLDSSGNLGIGTSSPGYQLDVVGGTRVAETAAGNGYEVAAGSTNILTSYNRTTSAWLPLRQRANQHEFYCDGVETLRLTPAGNLGLGVTPSAWTTFKVFQSQRSAFYSYSDGSPNAATGLAVNAFYDGSWKYIASLGAARYEQSSQGGGAHAWSVAASGTAGNAITWTQAMTLSADGSLGVGTTSPAAFGGYKVIDINGSTGGLLALTSNGTNKFQMYVNGSSTTLINVASEPLIFGTNNAERARITSGGELVVGDTSVLSSSKVTIYSATNAQIVSRNTLATAGQYWRYEVDASNDLYIINHNTAGVYIANGGTSWSAVSDERLKTNLAPIENAVEKVSTLRAVTGRYKTDEEGVSRAFLIAQDVQAVLPEAVNKKDDDIGTLGLAYTETIPLLVAAIKELKAELDAAKVKIAALEAK